MAETPTIGLALIARDEADDLPRLLDSAVGAFDQVALADTGSTDGTPEVFTAWADDADLPLGYRVETFPWCDDFAAARTFADSLLTTDWIVTLDADDELRGAEFLRQLIGNVPDNCGCLAFHTVGDERNPDPRVRAYRRDWIRWDGRVHEVPMLTRFAHIGFVSDEIAVVRFPNHTASDARDSRILADWLTDEPTSARALGLQAAALAREGEREQAADLLARYLDTPTISGALGPEDLDASRRALASFRSGLTDDLRPVLFGGVGS